MTYRVIQWSTGNVGRHALRCIARHPDLELVGLWVHSPDKAGRDAGEIAGIDPTGVLATNDADALLALDADCVSYTATADLRPGDAVTDMARMLASGKNVVSSSVVSLVYPPHVHPNVRTKLEAACTTGECRASRRASTRVGPTTSSRSCSRACEYIDELRVMEVVNYATYAQPTVLFDTMGFGQPLDAKPLLLLPGVLSLAWGGVVKVLAAGLGVEIDELREVHERRPAPRDLDLGFGVVEEGTTAAMRFEVQGIVNGEVRIVLEHVTRLADDLCPDWPQPIGESGYRVIVTGNPTYTCDVQMMGDDGDHNTGGLVGTAARLINAIPAVCAAPPGLLSVLDLPLIPGAALRSR